MVTASRTENDAIVPRGAPGYAPPPGGASQKLYAGAQIRHLRERRGLRQADLSRLLGLSPSYVNQLERNRRPVTVPVLLRLTEVFDVGAEFFARADTARLVSELRDAFVDAGVEQQPGAGDLEQLATSLPVAAAAVLQVHRAYRDALERLTAREQVQAGQDAGAPLDGGGETSRDGLTRGLGGPAMPHEAVRDIFHAHQNHFDVVDRAAERRAEDLGLRPGDARPALLRHLRDAHGVRTVLRSAELATRANRHFDPRQRVLTLGSHLRPGQQAFQLAMQVALLEEGEVLDAIAEDEVPDAPQTARLLRIGLAQYYAGALILPYESFRSTAEELRYDVELLGVTFGVGFEVVCHRLSTLQRPGARGVPFSFVRVDRAGNVSKRQSATGFHFSRSGGTCPLWVVYDAFATPGQIRTQVAEMPDGREYLWVARTTSRGQAGFGRPTKTFAVGLGCELHHADRLVYGDGARPGDFGPARPAVPIGMGCKACLRQGCPQRAFPPVGRALEIDEDTSPFDPYRVRAAP